MIKRIWRNRVNQNLTVAKIFKQIDSTIFLKVPSFKHVFKWRLLQEKTYCYCKRKKTMSKNEIKRFIVYYERITKQMLQNLNNKANLQLK